jgi:NTP pyrophosphatase (non-canonical NTP hydrolase)
MIHSEVSEATEDLRIARSDFDLTAAKLGDADDKPSGFAIELADALIRILDLAEWLGIDIEDVVAEKMIYNARRSHRHGDKNL